MVLIPTSRPPTHPGEMLLEEFLKPLSLSQKELAGRIGVSYPRVNERQARRDAGHGASAQSAAGDDPGVLAKPSNGLGSVCHEPIGLGPKHRAYSAFASTTSVANCGITRICSRPPRTAAAAAEIQDVRPQFANGDSPGH
jgi:hypothetical protein